MSTITLPNIRVSSDLTIRLKLTDGGVAIAWSTLQNIKACIYSDAQRALAGRCAFSIDEEDNTLLVCTYAANKPQYLGVNRIVISAKYMGETKTYDKPAFSFVRWTADQEGEEITIDDPDVDVEIDVEDISSSILQEAVDAAFSAADRANDAAAAAEHMVDIHTGPEGKSAYEVAVEEGYTGTEEEWLASLKGDTGETPDISIGTVTTVEPGTPAAASMTGTPEAPVLNLSIPQGVVGATPNFTVGTVTTGEPGSSVIVTITGTPEAPVLNLTIPQGMQGNTGSSVAYPYELVNNLTTNDSTKGLSAAQGVVLDGKVSQLRQEVTADISQLEAKVDENTNFTETEEGSLVVTTSEVGMVQASQTVGQPVVLVRQSGFGNIQYFDPIPKGATVTVNFSSQSGYYGFALCDANGIVLESCTNNGLDSYTFQPQNIVTYLYASSMKFASGTYSKTTIIPVKDSIVAVEGRVDTISSSVSEIGQKVDDIDDVVVVETEPVYEEIPLTLLEGYYYYSSGEFVSASDKRCADIVVSEGEKYKITSHLRAAAIALIVEWDGNGNYVGYVKLGTGVDEDVVDYEYTVPSGVAKIGISNGDVREAIGLHAKKQVTRKTSNIYTKEETNSLLEGYYTKEEIDEKNEINSTETEELPPSFVATGYVNPDQTAGETVSFIESTGFGQIYGFPTIPSNSIVTINFSSQSGAYGFALCDENDKVLEYCRNTNLESYTFGKTTVKTKLYASSSKLDKAVRVTTSSETVKEAIVRINQEIDEIDPKANRWTGKTIWWCGTSIPAGSDATIPGADETIAGNYPTEVGNDLQATVINKAVGASMCRANVRTGDFVGANFSNITSCLSMTKEEIEDFIANYSTIKNVLTGNVPETLDATYLARLRAASFEDRLLPYLDGTYDMPDLFVIDHGHNDYKYTLSGGGSDIGLEPTVANIGGELAEDTFMTANNNAKLESFLGSLANIPSAKKAAFIASLNRNCYIGAVNFIVTLILHYNPHARILFISNYEYENGDQKGYAVLIPAQENLAKSWAFPLCEVYKYLGYSDHIIPGSMAWFNTTYPSQTPATTDITVYKAYLPDGVHPSSDITGDANNIYAGIISEFIKKIY